MPLRLALCLIFVLMATPALGQQPVKTPFDPPEAAAAGKKQPADRAAAKKKGSAPSNASAPAAPADSPVAPTREGPPTPESAPTPALTPPPGAPPVPLIPSLAQEPPLPPSSPFPPSAAMQPVPFDTTPSKASGPDWRLIGGIASMVVGAASFVVMGVALARLDALQDDIGFTAYRRGLSPDQSACAEAAAGARVTVSNAGDPAAIDELCSEADGWEVATYVTLPAGIVFLGVGTYLIFSSDTVQSTKTSLRVVPRVGRKHGGAALSLSF